MRIEKLTYEDYFETERTENFYFHLSEIDLGKLEASTPRGYKAYIDQIANSKDNNKMIEAVENLIKLAYCVPTEDGRTVKRSEELSKDFVNSPAYIALLEKLFDNPTALTDFIIGILPKKEAARVREELAKNPDLLKNPELLNEVK